MLDKTASRVEIGKNEINTLRVYSDRKEVYLNRRLNSQGGKKNLSMSIKGLTHLEKGIIKYVPVSHGFEVQPKILESKISKQNDFFDMSDGFK